jgi:multiple sugar transport system substrate-binding protein
MRTKSADCASVFVLALLFTMGGFGHEAGAQQSIRFWHSYTQPERVEAIKATAADFEKSTGIHVEIEIVPWPRMYEKWATALAARTLPDVAVALPDNYMGMWLAGASLPLDDVVQAMGGDSVFLPGVLDKNVRYQGKTIAILHYLHSTILIYRKDLLDEKGLKAPDTWEDLLKVCTALTDKPNRYGFQQFWSPQDVTGITWTLWPIMQSNQATFFDKDFNVTFNRPATVEAVKYIMQIQNQCSSPSAIELQKNKDQWDLLGGGKTAMHLDTIFSLFIVDRDNPALGKKLAAWYPPKHKQIGWLETPTSLALLKGKNPEGGKRWIRFLLEEKRYISFLHTIPGGQLPVTVAASKSQDFWSHPFIQAHRKEVEIMLEGARDGHFTGMRWGINPYFTVVHNTNILANMFQRLVAEKIPVEQAVADAHRELEKAVAEMKARGR